MNVIHLAIFCFLGAASLNTHASEDSYILDGHTVIKDARTWSCKALTQEEEDEVAKRPIDGVLLGASPDRSCLVRDESGKAALLRVRQVQPGSMLLTYDEQSETYMRQTWSSRAISPKTFTDGKTFAIQLPQIRISHDWETWKGSPEGPTQP